MNFYEKAGTEQIGDATRTHFSNEITSKLDGKDVILMGWTHTLRDKGKIKFLILRDEHGIVQVTIPQKNVSEEVFVTAGTLKPETAVSVHGKVVATKQVAAGAEVIPTKIRILNTAQRLPIDVVEGKVDIELDTRLNHRILDLRKV
ncbi:MAG: OB-fold nucleic acid binding domain-containing protein [Candidatus Thorarchaeota archaeon]|jgi:aspartyl-tRNA synthetase